MAKKKKRSRDDWWLEPRLREQESRLGLLVFWLNLSLGVRACLVGTLFWAMCVFAFFLVFDPYDKLSGRDVAAEDILKLLAILAAPAIFGTIAKRMWSWVVISRDDDAD